MLELKRLTEQISLVTDLKMCKWKVIQLSEGLIPRNHVSREDRKSLGDRTISKNERRSNGFKF